MLVGLDGQLWLIHPAVCFAQPEPLGHVLGLQGDELLEDLGRLLPPRLLEVLGDVVLQLADVDLRRLFRHPLPFLTLLPGSCQVQRRPWRPRRVRPPGLGGPWPCRRAGSATGARRVLASAFFPA